MPFAMYSSQSLKQTSEAIGCVVSSSSLDSAARYARMLIWRLVVFFMVLGGPVPSAIKDLALEADRNRALSRLSCLGEVQAAEIWMNVGAVFNGVAGHVSLIADYCGASQSIGSFFNRLCLRS